MQTVFVTGATGFIGRFVVEELLRQKFRVVASSRDEVRARSLSWFHDVTYKAFDLTAFNADADYFNFFERPDIMIHLAWEGLPNYTSAFHVEDNLPRHLAFLSNIVRHGLRDLTVTGTCLEYGKREGALSEDMNADPQTAYAIAKDRLRKEVSKLEQSFAFQLKWVRLFYLYGTGQSRHSIISQLETAIVRNEPVFNMSGGEQLRDYLPVETAAQYIVSIATQKSVTGIINCCSGQPVTIKELVSDYIRQRNAQIALNLGYYPYNEYEPMRFWGDDKKLKTIIGYG